MSGYGSVKTRKGVGLIVFVVSFVKCHQKWANVDIEIFWRDDFKSSWFSQRIA